MFFIKRSELRGIALLIVVAAAIGGVLAAMSGKLETWFGLTIGAGPRLYDKILFVSGRSGSNEIYVADADGAHVRQLTSGAQAISAPFVSPNGSRVVFVGRVGKSSEVYLVRGSGGEPERLTSTTGPKAAPQYSPDGTRLAFLSGGTVYVAGVSGEDPQPVLPTDEERHEAIVRRDPMPGYSMFAWAPDGKGMAGIVNDASLGDVIAYLPAIGGNVQRIAIPADSRVSVVGICWASSRQVLGVAAAFGKRSVAALLDLDEKKAQGIAESLDGPITSIAISPDATQAAISFLSRRKPSDSGIRTVDLSTGEHRMIAKGEYRNLSYSPSGYSLVAQMELPGGRTDIATVDVTSGNVTRLTRDGKSFGPVWSPASPK